MVTLLILSGIYFIQVSVQAGNWQVYSMYSNHIDTTGTTGTTHMSATYMLQPSGARVCVFLKGVRWYSPKRPCSKLAKSTFLTTYRPYLFFALDIESPCSRKLQHVAKTWVVPVVSLACMVGIYRVLLPVFQQPTKNLPLNKLVIHVCVIDCIFSQIERQFTADQHARYIFTFRDLTKWTQSLLCYGLQESTEETSLLEVFSTKPNCKMSTTKAFISCVQSV